MRQAAQTVQLASRPHLSYSSSSVSGRIESPGSTDSPVQPLLQAGLAGGACQAA